MSDIATRVDSLDALARKIAEAYFAGCKAHPQDFGNFYEFRLSELSRLATVVCTPSGFWQHLSKLIAQGRGLRITAEEQRGLAEMDRDHQAMFAAQLVIAGQDVFAEAIAEEAA